MGIFKRSQNDIVSQWGPRLFLEFTAQDIYGDGPVVNFYKHVTSRDKDIAIIKTYGKPDVQQRVVDLVNQVMNSYVFPLVTSKKSDEEEAVLIFATALLHSTAQLVTGNARRDDPTGFEMGLCLVIGESLCRLSALKMRNKYAEVVTEGLLSLSAWMLNFDNENFDR
jgi:hypothetical protein